MQPFNFILSKFAVFCLFYFWIFFMISWTNFYLFFGGFFFRKVQAEHFLFFSQTLPKPAVAMRFAVTSFNTQHVCRRLRWKGCSAESNSQPYYMDLLFILRLTDGQVFTNHCWNLRTMCPWLHYQRSKGQYLNNSFMKVFFPTLPHISLTLE